MATEYDSLDFETTPAAESCEQVGPNHNEKQALKEAKAFRNQMIRVYGQPPKDCKILIKRNEHDFGVYLSLRIIYLDEKGCDYTMEIDSHPIEEWDNEAREELGLPLKE